MSNIEKIKAKIKRLMKETDASQFGTGGRYMCRIILDFIHSLSEEKLSEDLKEAAEQYTQEMLESWKFDSTGLRPIREPFIAGAEWQMQRDTELIEIAYNDGITIGKIKQKEQMLKDAVEGEVIYDLGGFFRIKSEAIDGAKYKVGSWVKLIIVKED